MDDKEIIEQLIKNRTWWEQRIEIVQTELFDCKQELAKTNRLIELLEEKLSTKDK